MLALDHIEDSGAKATMYPSAPRGETLKRTLTQGDAVGAQAVVEGTAPLS